MKHHFAAFLLSASIAATPALADLSAFHNATKVSQVKKLGAQQITGESIRKIVSGRTLKHPDWTWTFKRNGSVSSTATDKSWTVGGTWEIVGNQLCRTNPEKEQVLCSDVYLLERSLKFTEKNNRTLAGWYASY